MNNKRAKLKAIVIAFALVFSGFATLMLVPQSVAAQDANVWTEEETDIRMTSATLNMGFNMTDLDEVTVWFNYTDSETWDAVNWTTAEQVYTENDTHAAEIPGLTENTTYYFKAVLTYTDEGDNVFIEGDVYDFTTLLADVETLAATDIGANKATVDGEASFDALDFDVNVTVGFYAALEGEELSRVWYEELEAPGTFSSTPTGLFDNTTYEYRAFLIYIDPTTEEEVTVWGELMTVTTLETAAEVTTLPADEITINSAKLHMEFNITAVDEENVTAFFGYREITMGEGALTEGFVYGQGNETHDAIIEDLTPGAEYEFVGILEYWNETEGNNVTAYGEILNFETDHVAMVYTLNATYVKASMATLNMEVNLLELYNATVWFEYTDDADDWVNATTTEQVEITDSGEYSAAVTELNATTEYYFRAMLEECEGYVVEGEVLDFTTELVTVTTVAATDVLETSAVLHMEFDMGDFVNVTVLFEFGEYGEVVTEVGEKDMGVGNTTHSYEATGLAMNTKYNFTAVLQHDGGEIKGYTLNFTTLSEVTTLPATGITADSATLNMRFNMTTHENATAYFYFAEDGEDMEMAVGSNVSYGAGNETHSHTVTELDAYTDYVFRAVLLDADDEEIGTGEIVGFSTKSTVAIDGPAELMVGVEGTFEADVDGTAVSYTWTADGVEVGDDANTLVIDFDTVGPRTIALTIVDGNDETAATSHVVDIQVEVTITVLDVDEDPIADASVSLSGDLGYSGAEETDANGHAVFVVYSVSGVVHTDVPENMSYTASASHVDYQAETTTFTGLNTTITLTAATEWDVTIGPVRNVDGVDIPGVDVVLSWNGETIEGVTGTNGRVVFTFDENPYAWEFTAVLTHEEYMRRTITFSGSDTGPIVMSDRAFTIGPVVDQDTETPIDGVSVTLTVDEWTGQGVTDDTGRAEFVGLLPFDPTDIDSYHVELSHADYYAVTVEEYVIGDTIHMEQVPDEYEVTVGPLKNRAGKFINDATVTISWNSEQTETSGVYGMYTFELDFDPSGTTFTYTISHPDLEEDVTGTFTGESSGEIDLEIGEAPDEAEPGMSMALIGGLAVLILIIIVVVVMMMKKKPAEEVDEEEEEDLFEEEEEEPLFEEEEELFEEEEEEPLFEEEEELFEEEEEEPLFDDEEL